MGHTDWRKKLKTNLKKAQIQIAEISAIWRQFKQNVDDSFLISHGSKSNSATL